MEMRSNQQHDLTELAMRLRMAVVPFARELQRRLNSDFTPTELSLLGIIDRHGPLRLGELASRERLSLPRVSTVVASLESAGIVERIDDPLDGRATLVRTSSNGQQWINRVRAERDAWLSERLAALSSVERAAVEVTVSVLEHLNDG